MIIQNCFKGEWCSHLKIQNKPIRAEQYANFSYLPLEENLKFLGYVYVQGFYYLKKKYFHFMFNLVFVWFWVFFSVWFSFFFVCFGFFPFPFAFSLK